MATSIAGPGVLLADVQVTSLAASTSGFNTVSGQTNTQGSNSTQMTPNSVGSTQPYTGTKWHGLYLDVMPGILNPGQTEPDLQMYFKVDGVDFSSYFYVDISISKNMLPHKDVTVGQKFITLGNSLYKAAFSGGFGANLPMEFTGPKIAQGIDFWFASTSGFTTGSGGTFLVPPTIKLYGDVHDAASWNFVVSKLGPAWPGAIKMTSMRRQLQGLAPYSAVHVASLAFDGGFQQLPDGPKQGAVQVHRFLKYATPLIAASGASIYPLTNLVQGIGGKAGQVGVLNDLGFQFNKTNKALRVTEFGHRPAAGAGYMGITKGTNNVYPVDTSLGVVDTPGNPHAWYGQQPPVTNQYGQYFRLPLWNAWNPNESDKEVFAAEDIGFFVASQSGLTIAASTDFMAVGGVMVEA